MSTPDARRDDETWKQCVTRLVAEDPGIPVSLLIYRANGDVMPTGVTSRNLWYTVEALVTDGVLREVTEGSEGHRPISRRLWIAEEGS